MLSWAVAVPASVAEVEVVVDVGLVFVLPLALDLGLGLALQLVLVRVMVLPFIPIMPFPLDLPPEAEDAALGHSVHLADVAPWDVLRGEVEDPLASSSVG